MAEENSQAGGGRPAPHSPGPDPVEHGKRATFDPKTGEVHGSGSGAGGGGNPREDHDGDPMAGAGRAPAGDARRIEEAVQRPIDADEGAWAVAGGKGHPTPGSDEARHNEIPESLEGGKGRGDDPQPVVQPGRDAVNPDGERYRYDDLGRAENVKGDQDDG